MIGTIEMPGATGDTNNPGSLGNTNDGVLFGVIEIGP